ncbi:hypothetical protein EVAR_11451_1 [Eumeta japonica]|uniref:Uncharacterized protein n=1 Tax=Eumeta variegata TaxID=151549 RepID=A0A4C1TM57_EUMVA|nr:hypothetical protein EVAR_11451_1 [Eumeta japonica]
MKYGNIPTAQRKRIESTQLSLANDAPVAAHALGALDDEQHHLQMRGVPPHNSTASIRLLDEHLPSRWLGTYDLTQWNPEMTFILTIYSPARARASAAHSQSDHGCERVG